VGGGAAREMLIAKARDFDLDNCIFHPAQPKGRMPEFWGLLDVALIHLKNDPVFRTVIPSKIFEAMGMGIPILLAGPAGGEAEEIVNGEGVGLSIPSDDPSALAAAVMAMKRGTKRRKAFTLAESAAAPKYTRERQARAVLDICAAVMGR